MGEEFIVYTNPSSPQFLNIPSLLDGFKSSWKYCDENKQFEKSARHPDVAN